MPVTYSDNAIAALLAEAKPLPLDWAGLLQPKPKRGHQESELKLTGSGGNEFHLILRKSSINPLDFSAILGVRVPQTTRIFRLRRYNGQSHQHTNRLERETFYGFHIHLATERYQELGGREDAYAQTTNRYGDLQGALGCLLQDAGFEPGGPQGSMFLMPPEV